MVQRCVNVLRRCIKIPTLSIIVPVYNAELNLHKCIDSILAQNLKDIRVILVNDGSTDSSGNICDEYAELDKRICVLHMDNQGVGNARNKGLELAKGDFIGFVDSDDWIEENMYSVMLGNLESTGADIAVCGYLLYDGEKEKHVAYPWGKDSTFETDEIHKLLIPSMIAPMDMDGNRMKIMPCSVWRCLFKIELIRNNGIIFEPHMRYAEDILFIIESFYKAKKISFINEAYYHYRREKESRNSTTQKYMDNLYHYLKFNLARLCDITRDHGYLDLLQLHLHWRKFYFLMFSIANLCLTDSPYSFKDKVGKSRYYIKDSKLSEALKALGKSYFTPKQRTLALLAKRHSVALIIIYYTYKLKKDRAKAKKIMKSSGA